MKLSEVEEKLKKIKFVLKEDTENEEYSIDNFSSFLTIKNELKSNNEIQDFFKNKNLPNFTPTDIVKNKLFEKKSFGLPKKDKDNKYFLKESFKFPENFFNSDDEFNNRYMFVGLNAAERAGVTDYSNWGNFRDVKNPTNTFKMYTQLNDPKFKGCYITDIIKSVIDSDSGNISRNFFIGDKNKGSKELSFLTHPGINAQIDSQRVAKYTTWQNIYYKEKRAEEYKKVGDLMNLITETFIEDKTKNIKYSYEFHYEKKVTGQQLLEKNRNIIEQSIKCFVSECLAVHPEKLVVFGETANYFLTEMSGSTLFDDYVNELAKGQDRAYVKNLISNNRLEVTHYAAYNIGHKKGVLRFS